MSPERNQSEVATRGVYPWADRRRGLGGRLGRALGLRHTFIVDGVRYRELNNEPLRASLSRRGPGFKDFDVRFRSGESMRIRCTRERVFADLAPPPRLPVLLRIERLLRPGMRVLVTPCGTGFSAALVAGRVAPSGAVVALDPDVQSIEYARLRHPIAIVSFECGGLTELRGETDWSFDAVIVAETGADRPDDATIMEYWRLVSPGGWLAVAFAATEGSDVADEAASLASTMARLCTTEARSAGSSSAHVGPLGDGRDGWIAAIARRDTPS